MSFLNNFNQDRNQRYLKPSFSIRPKKLCFGQNKNSGRNNSGQITMYYRGGGQKRTYRNIDFYRDYLFFWNVPAFIRSIEYDPNRSSYIALVQYANGFVSYILATENMEVGKTTYTGFPTTLQDGTRIPLSIIGFGNKFTNLRYYARSAGTFLKYLGLEPNGYCLIGLPSGAKKLSHRQSLITLGSLSNSLHYSKKKFKAGQSRWVGRRPHVRGVAKNPIDHPHGGGQGKTAGGRVSVTPWGIYTKGYKTKRKKIKSNSFKF